MKASDIEEMAEFMEVAKELAPAVSEIVDTVVDLYGPILSKLLDAVYDKNVANRIKAYKAYTEAGIMPDQAIALILSNSGLSFQNTLESLAKNLTTSYTYTENVVKK